LIIGLIFAFIAGALVSVQNIFNSKVNQQIGNWSTTTLVLGLGFLASLLLGLLFEGIQLFQFRKVEFWYWFCGLFGVGVVTCLVQGIKLLGPTVAISIAMLAQLGMALIWDSLGLFGFEKIPLTLNQIVGVSIFACGILIFKLGNNLPKLVSPKVEESSNAKSKTWI
jgi:bacterial/archaeal transporter family-2 protein